VTIPRRLLAVLAAAFVAASGAGASTLDTQRLSKARDIKIERREWSEPGEPMRTIASAHAKADWLSRLAQIVLRDSSGAPDTTCTVACGRCPDQVWVTVGFSVDGTRHHLWLLMREGIAFLNSDTLTSRTGWASPFRFADATEDVAELLREVSGHEAIIDRAWRPPAAPPAPLSPDSAAFRFDMVFLTAPPEAVHQVWPVYPKRAREAGVSGTIEVYALVTAEGTVAAARATGPRVWPRYPSLSPADPAKSDMGMREAAVNAVRAWTFKPAMCGSRPVAYWVKVPVRFKLQD